ncbi:hypothetical protein D9M69_276100 [compost metagenome]
MQIRRAEYRLSNGQVTVEASTSDEVTPPSLTVAASSGASIGTLAGSGAVKSLTTGFTPIPPAYVTVTSANGGSDTEEVLILP